MPKLLDSSRKTSESNRCREAYLAWHDEEGLPVASVSTECFPTSTANTAFLNATDSGLKLSALAGIAFRLGSRCVLEGQFKGGS